MASNITREDPESLERLEALRDALRATRLLLEHGYRVVELAAALGTGRRTTYRIMEALKGAGLKLTTTVMGRRVYYSLTVADLLDAFGLDRRDAGHVRLVRRRR